MTEDGGGRRCPVSTGPTAAVLVLAAGGQCACLVLVVRRRDSPGAFGLAALLASVLFWDIANAVELRTATIGGRELWGALKYLGIGLMPPAWLTFVAQYTGTGRPLARRTLLALSVVPIVMLGLLATPHTRQLLRHYPSPTASAADAGPLFWPLVVYTGTLMIAGLVTFLARLVRASPVYRGPSLLLASVALLPLAGILAFNLGAQPFGVVDPTPLAFSVAAPLLTIGFFRFRLLQLRPLARARILAMLDDAVLVLDGYGRITDALPAGERLLGCTMRAAVGRQLSELLPGWTTTVADPGPAGTSDRVPLQQGGRFYEVRQLRLPARRGVDGGGVLLVVRDVTDQHLALAGRRAAERAREAADARFGAAFQSALVGMALVEVADERERIALANQALANLTGCRTAAELMDRDLTDLVLEEEREVVRELVAGVATGGERSARSEVRMLPFGTAPQWAVLGVAPIPAGDGSPQFVLVQAEDVTERHLSERRLREQALHDPLTGLANRLLLSDRLQQALEEAVRSSQAVGVLLFDLDRFKNVNDTFGHAVGDGLLQAVAYRLIELLRPGDTVARLGGDEFAVVLPNLEDPRRAGVVASRILEAVARPYPSRHGDLHISASLGIAVGQPSADPEILLRDADAAMYLAKHRGRDCWAEFSVGLRRQLVHRMRTERALRASLSRHELVLYYQPIVSLPDGRVVAVEGLLRWRHPTRGLLLPDQFLPVADDAGLINDIGREVMRRALHDVATVMSTGQLKSLTISLNIAARQLLVPTFARDVLTEIGASGVDPSRICLEITEEALLQTPDATANQLSELGSSGVRIALDDFGTGYSSLSRICQLSVHILKIDRSFIGRALQEQTDRRIVQLIIDLAHALDIMPIAEGVETEEQLRLLLDLQCDQAQGYLLGRPQPADRILETVTLAEVSSPGPPRRGPHRGPHRATQPVGPAAG